MGCENRIQTTQRSVTFKEIQTNLEISRKSVLRVGILRNSKPAVSRPQWLPPEGLVEHILVASNEASKQSINHHRCSEKSFHDTFSFKIL